MSPKRQVSGTDAYLKALRQARTNIFELGMLHDRGLLKWPMEEFSDHIPELKKILSRFRRDVKSGRDLKDQMKNLRDKRELLHEWMHRFEFLTRGRVFRVWTKRTTANDLEFDAQHAYLAECLKADEPVKAILELHFVSAIEDLDRDGNGRLVYVDWP